MCTVICMKRSGIIKVDYGIPGYIKRESKIKP